MADYTYASHVGWMAGLLDALDVGRVTLVGQDWGGLIGLRLVAEQPQRFARVVASNTGLPIGDRPMPEVWQAFRRVVVSAERLDVGRIVAGGCRRPLSADARRATLPGGHFVQEDAGPQLARVVVDFATATGARFSPAG